MVGSLTISLGLGLVMLTGGYMFTAVLECKIWLSNSGATFGYKASTHTVMSQ